MPAVAFLGLGTMGAPMANRLRTGYQDLVVWNRTAERATPFAEAGTRVAGTPREAAAEADVVITMLTGPAAVRSVLFGPDGVAESIRPGGHLVEMSTIGPAEVHALAGRLPDGVRLVDAPVGGSVPHAESGRLIVLAGGARSAVEQVRPVLERLGTVRHCGGLGTGAAAKLVVNTGLITGLAVLGEAVALADSLGVPREIAADVLQSGPLTGLLSRARDTASRFTVTLAAKDLALAADHADLPLTGAAAHHLQQLVNAMPAEDIRILAGLNPQQ